LSRRLAVGVNGWAMIIVAFGRFETRRLREAIPSFTLRADTIGGAQGDTRAGKS